MSKFPKNTRTTTVPEIAILLDDQGWLDITAIPLTSEGKYNIAEELIPFIHPTGMARLLLEADIKMMKVPDDDEKISYSEFPAHEDYRIGGILKKERARYINESGGLVPAIFHKLDKVEDYGLIKLAAYHKVSMAKFIEREEAMVGTYEIGINNIPYDNAYSALSVLKDACKPFGQIKVIIWQGIDSGNYYHRGWALCYVNPDDVKSLTDALTAEKISVKGATETRQIKLYVSKYSRFNDANKKSDPTKPRPSY